MKVSWDDYSQLNGNIKNVPNHQPVEVFSREQENSGFEKRLWDRFLATLPGLVPLLRYSQLHSRRVGNDHEGKPWQRGLGQTHPNTPWKGTQGESILGPVSQNNGFPACDGQKLQNQWFWENSIAFQVLRVILKRTPFVMSCLRHAVR